MTQTLCAFWVPPVAPSPTLDPLVVVARSRETRTALTKKYVMVWKLANAQTLARYACEYGGVSMCVKIYNY